MSAETPNTAGGNGEAATGPVRRGIVAWGVVAATATFLLLLATEPHLPIVWDEGFTVGREGRIRDWLRALDDPAAFGVSWRPPSVWADLVQPDGRRAPRPGEIKTRSQLFERNTLEWFWPFAREEPHGHPPFYALLGLVGDVLAPSWEALPRARLGPMIAFSLLAGALVVFVAPRWGRWAAALTVGAWVLQPRLFGHAHYAHYDAPLTCLWVASILAFARAVEQDAASPRRSPRYGWCFLFGVFAGCAAATKLTGWFLPLPFAAWTLLYRDRRGAIALVIGGIVALLILYACVPPWWGDPIGGVERFLRSNLTRARTTRIPTLFLGRVILTPHDSLPPYNTLVWTLFVTPVGFLTLALAGFARAVRRFRAERLGMLVVGNWIFLLILRALPHTPGHDAERQFLAAFGCLALVAGLGAGWAVERLGRWGKALIVAALAEAIVSVALMMPFPLSYFSPIVGGLPGASKLGMEPTYYWDALSNDALTWLNRNTPPGEKVLFPTYPTTWAYLRQSGRLKVGALPPEPGAWAWYVLQNRPGAFSPADRALVERFGPQYVLVQKWGVPLVWAFPYREFERLQASAGRPRE